MLSLNDGFGVDTSKTWRLFNLLGLVFVPLTRLIVPIFNIAGDATFQSCLILKYLEDLGT
eukprot:TRINITY_DN6539_c0_g1_i1.p2 TRINITY_DN6539_c0_g1~~TRINITY_DN6539_c0_g1_i1.p2  ORF type:complete len:60 (-),score=9.32 TRINITY_DN6539_c0_g1_i1:124-303(-)